MPTPSLPRGRKANLSQQPLTQLKPAKQAKPKLNPASFRQS